MAVELDGARRAVGLLCALLADLAVGQPGQLAARLGVIDDAAVGGHDSGELCAVLCAQGLDAAAAMLRDAHRRRRDAVQTLRRLADLDRRGLLDVAAVGGCLGEVAEDLAAAGRGIAEADREVLSGLSNLSDKSNLDNSTGLGANGEVVCCTESRATDPRSMLNWGTPMSDSGEFQVSVISSASRTGKYGWESTAVPG